MLQRMRNSNCAKTVRLPSTEMLQRLPQFRAYIVDAKHQVI